MNFDEWWKENGVEGAALFEKSAGRKGWEAGVNAEREACAKLCESKLSMPKRTSTHTLTMHNIGVMSCVNSIRARGNK